MYIGKQPIIGNFQVCDAISTVNNQAAYTLQVGGANVSPETVNNMICSVNGVIQKPTASYTVAGSTITFTSALVTGDVINFIQILGSVLDLGVPSDNTVTTAKIANANVTTAKITDANVTTAKIADSNVTTAKIADGAVTSAKLASGVAGGITMADQWRITANFSTTSADITANWERADTDGAGYIGTGMSESSGIFTFPSTGIYLVQGIANIVGSGTRTYMGINILTTLNNSSYSAAAEMYGSSYNNNAQVAITTSFIFDVTNTTNCKVKLLADGSGTGVWNGGTNELRTGFNFIRLGDT